MKLNALDRDPLNPGAMPISNALMWLHKLINDPAVNWDPEQRAEALRALGAARVTMVTELTVRQKDGGGFALDFLAVMATPPKYEGLLTEDAAGRRH